MHICTEFDHYKEIMKKHKVPTKKQSVNNGKSVQLTQYEIDFYFSLLYSSIAII